MISIQPPTAHAGETAGTVAARGNGDVGAIAIVDGERIVGVVSLTGLAAHAASDRDVPIARIMQPAPPALHVDDSLEQAADMLSDPHVPFVPVLDGERFAGIVTRADVLDAYRSVRSN
jgi:CBS domain-containing protein